MENLNDLLVVCFGFFLNLPNISRSWRKKLSSNKWDIYFSVQEILIMILKKDLVHAHGRKLYKYNEDPSATEVGLKEIFFEKVWCFCVLQVHTNILTTILLLAIIELIKIAQTPSVIKTDWSVCVCLFAKGNHISK